MIVDMPEEKIQIERNLEKFRGKQQKKTKNMSQRYAARSNFGRDSGEVLERERFATGVEVSTPNFGEPTTIRASPTPARTNLSRKM